MSLFLRTVAAATISLAATHAGAATMMFPCSGCTTYEYRDTAETLGVGIRYVYDFPGNQVHKYSVTSTPYSEYMTVTEQTVESNVRSGFTTLRGVWLADSTYYTHTQRIAVPSYRVLGSNDIDLVNAAVRGTDNVTSLFNMWITDPARVRQIDSKLADVLSGRSSIGTMLMSLFGMEPSKGAYEIQLIDADGNTARFEVYSTGKWVYKGTYDQYGNRYPQPTLPATGSMLPTQLDRMLRELESANIPVTRPYFGTDAYLVCTYVGGKLVGCTVKKV